MRCNPVITGALLLVLLCVGMANGDELLRCDNDLKVFAPGEEVVFRWVAAEKTVFACNVVDYEGRSVIPGRLVPDPDGVIRLGKPGNGFYLLKCNYRENDTEKTVEVAFAVIPEIDNTLHPEKNPFGMMVFPHWNDPLALRELDARYIKRLGLAWVRTHKLGWIFLQKDANAPVDWVAAEAEIKNWKKYGLNIIATIGWPTPVWASSGYGVEGISHEEARSMIPAEKYHESFMRFHEELAQRFGKEISYYEIGNEVDAFEFWRGSPANWKKNDKQRIMADYVQMFSDIAIAVRKADPDAKLAPNTTGAAPKGHYYTPWLQTMYKLGLGKSMNAFSSHYNTDLAQNRRVMRECGGKELPIILTEAGAVVKRNGSDDIFTRGYMEEAMRRDMSQFVGQYFHGAKVICKFMLRPTPFWKDKPPYFCSLLRTDFRMLPNYVAFATIIRHLKDAQPVKELNITANCDNGWLEGYEFERDGQTINAIWLNREQEAQVFFQTSQERLEVVDMMGRSKFLPAVEGKVRLRLSTPMFVIGKIMDNPGEVKHPQPVLIREIDCSPQYMDFEKVDDVKQLTSWSISSNPGYRVSVAPQGKEFGKSLCVATTDKVSDWWPLRFNLDMKKIPDLQQGQYLLAKVEYAEKGEAIQGIGATCAIAVTDPSGIRLRWKDNPDWGRGTYDWQEKQMEWKIDSFESSREKLVIEFYLGKATGKVCFDNIRVTVSVYEDPRGGAANIN